VTATVLTATKARVSGCTAGATTAFPSNVLLAVAPRSTVPESRMPNTRFTVKVQSSPFVSPTRSSAGPHVPVPILGVIEASVRSTLPVLTALACSQQQSSAQTATLAAEVYGCMNSCFERVSSMRMVSVIA
jgi:hypothetical protein